MSVVASVAILAMAGLILWMGTVAGRSGDGAVSAQARFNDCAAVPSRLRASSAARE